MISIGRISRSQGKAGELRLNLYHRERIELAKIHRVYIGRVPERREFKVESLTPRGRGYHIKLEGVDSLSEADRLVGFEVLVPEETLTSLEKDEYYIWQLKDCTVLDNEGKMIGRVVDVLTLPAQNLLVLNSRGKEIFIPFHQSICRRIDIARKEIRIDPPQGLLEQDEI